MGELFAGPTVFSVVAYTILVRREERRMLEEFGDESREYRQRVRMLIPRSAPTCGRPE